MASGKPKITWKTLLPPVLGLIAFLLYLYIFNVDIPQIIATLQSVDPLVYSLAISTLIVSTFLFALSWRSLLNLLSVKLSVRKSFLYVWYGIFMDILIPAESISGEISRAYLVTKEQNGTTGRVVASLVAHRVIGTGINIASLMMALFALLVRGQTNPIVLNLTLVLIIGTTVFLALLVLLCVKEKWTLKVIDTVIKIVDFLSRGRWKLTKVRGKVVKAARMFHDSMKEFASAPKTVFTSLLLYVLSWLCSIGVSYLVFLSMGFSVPWSVIIITDSIMITIKGIPLGVPFEAGLPELTMPTLYTALLREIPLNIRATICATATILIRILTVWLRFFIGFAVQQWLGIKTTITLNVNNKLKPEPKKT